LLDHLSSRIFSVHAMNSCETLLPPLPLGRRGHTPFTIPSFEGYFTRPLPQIVVIDSFPSSLHGFVDQVFDLCQIFFPRNESLLPGSPVFEIILITPELGVKSKPSFFSASCVKKLFFFISRN